MYLINRSKHCSVKLVGDDLLVQAVLLDSVHEMVLEVLASPKNLLIKKVQADMVRVPFPLCQEVQEKAKSLEGLHVAKGLSGHVRERLGASEGCVHLSDLFMDAARALVQARYVWIKRVSPNSAEDLREAREELRGTCFYYSHKD